MDAADGPPGAGEVSAPPVRKRSSDDKRWEKDRVDAEHTRLARIQASANVWLGILGTLFGLSGAVVLIKGSTAFTTSTHNNWLHWGLLALVGLTFSAAILAFTMGGVATWGGLASPDDPDLVEHVFLDTLILRFGAPNSKESIRRWRDEKTPATYREKYNRWADRRRAYLHTSRGLGVVATLLAGGVMIWIFAAGTALEASPKIIVVHNGRITCGTVGSSEKYRGVTQVISVGQC